MAGFRDGFNYGIGWCIYGGLCTGFDGGSDGITLRRDTELLIIFQIYLLSFVMMEIF